MVKQICVTFVLIFTSSFLPFHANAQTEPHGWTVSTKQTSIDVKRSVQADVTFRSINLRTSDPAEPEVRFSCSEEFGLRVTLLLQPLSKGILHGGRHVRAKERFSRLAIDGRDAERVRWVHIKEVRALQSGSQKTAKMIYNAAIQGRSFLVKEPLKRDVEFRMPAVDEAFRRFARQCKITNGQ